MDPEKDPNMTLTKNQSQTGLEKVIGVISTYITRIRGKMSQILYGAFKLQNSKKANGIEKAMDRGIINLLRELSRVDFCNIFTYLANNKLGKSFNPSDKPPDPTDSTFKKTKYFVQIEAYKTQVLIDNFYAKYGTLMGADSRTGLLELLKLVNASISTFVLGRAGLNDPELRKEFPEVDLISNFFRDILGEISKKIARLSRGNLPIPTQELQNIFSTLDKVKKFCVAIQALNNPAAIIAVAGKGVQQEFEQLNKEIKYDKIIPLLYKILKTCNNINTVCRTILSYITTARIIVRFCILVINAFNVIKAFFVAIPTFPIPAGAGVALSETYQEVLKEQGQKKLIQVLKQISGVLDSVYAIVSELIIAITDIIAILNIILLNLKACNQDIAKDIENTVAELENTKKDLQKFIDEVNNNNAEQEKTIGEYSIDIINEELADEGISIRRRYGIARNSQGIIVAQSTPTFASLDLIIINEVKLLLEARGLIKQTDALSSENSLIAMYAMKYLDDNNIDLNSLSVTITDNDSTGLQSFMNNLPGGKALKNRIRKQLLVNSAKMGSDLKNSNSSGAPRG